MSAKCGITPKTVAKFYIFLRSLIIVIPVTKIQTKDIANMRNFTKRQQSISRNTLHGDFRPFTCLT